MFETRIGPIHGERKGPETCFSLKHEGADLARYAVLRKRFKSNPKVVVLRSVATEQHRGADSGTDVRALPAVEEG